MTTAIDFGVAPPNAGAMLEARLAFAHPLLRRLGGGYETGATLARDAIVRRLASEPARQSDGFTLDAPWLMPRRVRYRGAAWQNGDHIGFAMTEMTGALLLLSQTEPLPDAPIAVAAATDSYFGYAPNTLIDTPHGPQPIRTLGAGAQIHCADGAVEPLRSAVRIALSPLFADPLRALPIRICAGALGDGLPLADMLVSPDLALLLAGVLIQAGALVNGQTVRRETWWPDAYWRLRLARHGLARVHGVATETIRALPSEGDDEADADHADDPNYPRATSHRQVPYAIRDRLSRGKARPGALPLDPAGAISPSGVQGQSPWPCLLPFSD